MPYQVEIDGLSFRCVVDSDREILATATLPSGGRVSCSIPSGHWFASDSERAELGGLAVLRGELKCGYPSARFIEAVLDAAPVAAAKVVEVIRERMGCDWDSPSEKIEAIHLDGRTVGFVIEKTLGWEAPRYHYAIANPISLMSNWGLSVLAESTREEAIARVLHHEDRHRAEFSEVSREEYSRTIGGPDVEPTLATAIRLGIPIGGVR